MVVGMEQPLKPYWIRVAKRARKEFVRLVFHTWQLAALDIGGRVIAAILLIYVGWISVAKEHIPWELAVWFVTAGVVFPLVFIWKIFAIPAEMETAQIDAAKEQAIISEKAQAETEYHLQLYLKEKPPVPKELMSLLSSKMETLNEVQRSMVYLFCNGTRVDDAYLIDLFKVPVSFVHDMAAKMTPFIQKYNGQYGMSDVTHQMAVQWFFRDKEI